MTGLRRFNRSTRRSDRAPSKSMGPVPAVSQTVTFSNGLLAAILCILSLYELENCFSLCIILSNLFLSASQRRSGSHPFKRLMTQRGGWGATKEKLKWQLLPTFVLDGCFGLESAARIWQPLNPQPLRWRTLRFQPRLQVTTANWCFSSLLLGQQTTQSLHGFGA